MPCFVILAVTLGTVGCGSVDYQELQGNTMGTYYRLIAKCPQPLSANSVEAILEDLNSMISTYRPDSTISNFNDAPVGEWVTIANELVELIDLAQQISQDTDGMFDITVQPLVELWGFGSKMVVETPTIEEVRRARSMVDYRALEWQTHQPALRKLQELSIDLSGIGKGYAVDVLSEELTVRGCQDFMVDIGGEIRVAGHNTSRQPWVIGIEKPDLSGQVQHKLELSIGAVATSGNYRNFRIFNDDFVSHLIDPTTGYPVDHNLASVTVYERSAAVADALATALFVMGERDGFEYAVEQGLAVYFVVWDHSNEQFASRSTPAMIGLLSR